MSFSLEEPNSKEGDDMPLETETSPQDLHLEKLVLNEARLNPTPPTTSMALFNDLNWPQQLARQLALLGEAEVSSGSTCGCHT